MKTLDDRPIRPKRNFKKHPYTPCEARALEYLINNTELCNEEIADPIGELIAIARRKE